MNFSPLIKARKCLDRFWKEVWLKGRCWGPPYVAGTLNPYAASNITIAVGNELVSISQNPDGSLNVHEFSRAENTFLGRKVKAVLRKNKLKISKPKED
jgi:hypothetical protein